MHVLLLQPSVLNTNRFLYSLFHDWDMYLSPSKPKWRQENLHKLCNFPSSQHHLKWEFTLLLKDWSLRWSWPWSWPRTRTWARTRPRSRVWTLHGRITRGSPCSTWWPTFTPRSRMFWSSSTVLHYPYVWCFTLEKNKIVLLQNKTYNTRAPAR
jgi:hypothetical protein